jgi:hypothetical protein
MIPSVAPRPRSAAPPGEPTPRAASGPAPGSAAEAAAPAVPAPERDGSEAPRKLIRPSLPARAPSAAASPRRETVEDESSLLARASASGAVVVLRLGTGESLTGQIEWVDGDCLKLRRRDASPLLVMRAAVSSWEVEGSLRRG